MTGRIFVVSFGKFYHLLLYPVINYSHLRDSENHHLLLSVNNHLHLFYYYNPFI
jgi:hypothetical protein